MAIVAILVIGTLASIAFDLDNPAASNQPAAQTQPTATTGADLSQLVTLGDQAGAKGDWTSAVGYYGAYLGQDATNADVHFKLGKAYLQVQPPNYLEALSQLQQAVGINPNAPFAAEANSLINQYKDKVPNPAAITGTIGAGGTGVISPTTGITGTTNVTGTLPGTSTIAPTKTP